MNNIVPSFSAGIFFGGYIYFSCNEINALFRLNLKTKEIEYIRCFPEEEISQNLLHGKAFIYNNKIIFVPNQGNHIHILNTCDMNIQSIFIERKLSSRYAFNDSIINGDCLWIIPGDGVNDYISFNLSSLELERYESNEIINSNGNNNQLFFKSAYDGKNIFTVELNTSKIVVFELENKKIKIIKTDMERLRSPYYVCGNIWITNQDGKIYKWDYENNTSYQINNENDKDREKGIILFNYLDTIWGIHERGGSAFYLDKDSAKSVVQNEMNFIDTNSGQMGDLYTVYNHDKEIIIFPPNKKKIQIINNKKLYLMETRLIKSKEYKHCMRDITKMKMQRAPLVEGQTVYLEDYISALKYIK